MPLIENLKNVGTIYLYFSCSCRDTQQLPPRRLEPISNPTVAKKRKHTRKKDRPSTTTEDENTAPTSSEGASVLDEQTLIQLRSRLDPIYNPPPQGSSVPPVRLPPLGHPESEAPSISSPTVEDRGSEEASRSVSKSRKGPRRRTRQNRDRERATPERPGLNEEELTPQEHDGEQHVDLKSTSNDALIVVEPPPSSERKKRRREGSKEKSRRRVAELDESRDEREASVEESQLRRDGVVDSSVDGGLPPPQSEGMYYCTYMYAHACTILCRYQCCTGISYRVHVHVRIRHRYIRAFCLCRSMYMYMYSGIGHVTLSQIALSKHYIHICILIIHFIMYKGVDPVVDCIDEGVHTQGRQLPALPDDGEEMRETTMADELATTGGIPTARGEFVHPDG